MIPLLYVEFFRKNKTKQNRNTHRNKEQTNGCQKGGGGGMGEKGDGEYRWGIE